MSYGSYNRPVNAIKQQEWRDRVAHLRDVPLAELSSIFQPADVASLDRYQRGILGKLLMSPNHQDGEDDEAAQRRRLREVDDEILEMPFSSDFKERYTAEQLGILACNTGFYDDVIEDVLDDDPVILHISAARQRQPEDAEHYTQILRVRRSIAAIAVVNANESTPAV